MLPPSPWLLRGASVTLAWDWAPSCPVSSLYGHGGKTRQSWVGASLVGSPEEDQVRFVGPVMSQWPGQMWVHSLAVPDPILQAMPQGRDGVQALAGAQAERTSDQECRGLAPNPASGQGVSKNALSRTTWFNILDFLGLRMVF